MDALFDADTTSPRIEEAYGSFFILNQPLDFNALSVGKTLSIRVSSQALL